MQVNNWKGIYSDKLQKDLYQSSILYQIKLCDKSLALFDILLQLWQADAEQFLFLRR
jgi:hypothetical protein